MPTTENYELGIYSWTVRVTEKVYEKHQWKTPMEAELP